ncbi:MULTISPECIES: BON domain-containing protein [Thioalkalivibrio]|uniref:Osmotically-inducible protein Y n=1 Tax=Thioalkalivibrio versutus TaxID=106634 RepID=A0A0G3G4E5_9GAMM|nr:MULTISPECIES: BON domain-containing protein [Thioalkalivibrio]AKJ95249.1 transporter [Thioalkalivibrio versutus]OOC51167.1 BON domain-containing protein [Thioalkalivibrio versutus]
MRQLRYLPPIFLTLLLALLLAGCAASNERQTVGEYVDDSVITTKVKAALFNEPSLSGFEVSVETYEGRVQLSGFVSSQEDINKAVEIARGVEGVRSVENDMQLK